MSLAPSPVGSVPHSSRTARLFWRVPLFWRAGGRAARDAGGAQILKEHLRGKLLGDKFWTPLTIKRKDRLPTNDDIIDMYRRLRTENADFKRQMRQADAAGSVAPSG